MRSILRAKYESVVQELQKVLDEVEHCSMTTDFWTSRACESFVTVTCHFILTKNGITYCMFSTPTR